MPPIGDLNRLPRGKLSIKHVINTTRASNEHCSAGQPSEEPFLPTAKQQPRALTRTLPASEWLTAATIKQIQG